MGRWHVRGQGALGWDRPRHSAAVCLRVAATAGGDPSPRSPRHHTHAVHHRVGRLHRGARAEQHQRALTAMRFSPVIFGLAYLCAYIVVLATDWALFIYYP